MDKDNDDPNGVLLQVERDDDGNIVGWEMDLNRSNAHAVLDDLIAELRRNGQQNIAKHFEAMLERITKTEKTDSKKKTQKK